jgi:YD repeat-containing protein
MSVRAPLYNNSGNIQEMTTAMVDEVVDQIVYQYSLNPSVSLSVVGSGGSLGAISDTRLQAGAATTDATDFDTAGETPDVSTVTVNYDKLTSTSASVTPTTDTGTTWPLYYNSSGQIQAMNLTDIKDTFLHPAIDLLSAATTTTQQAGTHFISSATSVSGSTRVSATPIFSDTRANAAAYTSGGINETQDQPTTITNYYLYTVDGSDTSYTAPFFINGSNNLQVFAEATFESLIQEWIRYTAASSTDGYAISYNLGTSGSGNERGSGMADTKLNSSTYTQRFVNANDYRTQEFPSGTAVTQNTYYLRINKS